MSGFSFGARSREVREELTTALQGICDAAIQRTPYDFSLICGYRSVEDQQQAFRAGNSRIDGITRKSQHNYLPARAIDLMPFPAVIAGQSVWQVTWRFQVIAGVMLAVAAAHAIPLRWGGDWDGDGTVTDQTLFDPGHFELVT